MTANAGGRWRDESLQPTRIEVGDWTIDRVGAGLSNIRFRGVSVLRAIRVVVRDGDWRTVEPRVTDIAVDNSSDEYCLEIRARCTLDDVDFAWEATMRLEQACLCFEMTGDARREFERNRIGLIVLHLPGDAGAALRVVHPDGDPTVTRFPTRVAPHQPALDIVGLAWTRQGIDIGLRFAGDIFEMEDQRNWTDASFKTYSTRLSDPFPVCLEPGDRVEQSVTVTCAGTPTRGKSGTTDSVLGPERQFPAIALASSTAPADSQPKNIVRAPVSLVELDARDSNWPAALARAAADAAGGELDVRIVARDANDVAAVVDGVAAYRLARLAVFDATTHVSEPSLWCALFEWATEHNIDAELVAGTRAHFTELNRTHERLPHAPLTFSVTPQMHDTETQQIGESIAMQRIVAENAVRIADGEPVHVGPITLRPRFNAVATTPREPAAQAHVDRGYGAEFVWGATDERQTSPAMAAWTIAGAIALAIDGVASVTLGEDWGPRGLADEVRRFPVADAAEMLIARSGERSRNIENTPEGCWGAVFPERHELLLANVSDHDAKLMVESLGMITVPALSYVQRLW